MLRIFLVQPLYPYDFTPFSSVRVILLSILAHWSISFTKSNSWPSPLKPLISTISRCFRAILWLLQFLGWSHGHFSVHAFCHLKWIEYYNVVFFFMNFVLSTHYVCNIYEREVTSNFSDLNRVIFSILVEVCTWGAWSRCNRVAPYTCPVDLRCMSTTEMSAARSFSISRAKLKCAYEESCL
jgi:hypothetical protein